MRTTTRTLVAAAVVATVALPAAGAAQNQPNNIAVARPVPSESPILPVGTSLRSKLTVVEEARMARRLSEADQLTVDGRFAEARTILRQVADDQARADAYPAVALRRLANVEFGLGHAVAAAMVLEELAGAARKVGDPQVEITALVDAVILYMQEGRRTKARELRPRIKELLDSPAIAESTRREIARHLDPR